VCHFVFARSELKSLTLSLSLLMLMGCVVVAYHCILPNLRGSGYWTLRHQVEGSRGLCYDPYYHSDNFSRKLYFS
jgi:hypothetical protein